MGNYYYNEEDDTMTMRYNILSSNQLKTLQQWGNTVISVETYTKALWKIYKESPLYNPKCTVLSDDKKEVFEKEFMSALKDAVGFKCSIKYVVFAPGEKPYYKIERVNKC